MKKKGESKIKLTVFLGYSLVVIVMAVGLVALYKNLVDFSNRRIGDKDMSELIIVGNTLSMLYDIESNHNLFTAENALRYFEKYDSIIPKIEINLDRLKTSTDDTIRSEKLDSIKLLMRSKRENLYEIAMLLDSIRIAPSIIRERVSSTVPSKLNSEISEYLENKNILSQTDRDTTIMIGERKSFAARVKNLFVADLDSTVVIKESSVVKDREFKLIVDTIINKVLYSERLDLERQRELQVELIERQDVMSGTNRMLTARIDELLKEVEHEEMRKSLQLISDRENTLFRSQNIMQIVSLIASLIALLFIILFLIDINRSRRYREQLEASNRYVSQLLASREKLMLMISHDIKAPTGSILGFIELMSDELNQDLVTEKGKNIERLANMRTSANHVLQLVGTLLDYHKLESGTWQLNEYNFNIHSIVDETAASFRPLAEKKGVGYSINNHIPNERIIYGDPYILRLIISNLISNAVKYTSVGEISVTATFETVLGDKKFPTAANEVIGTTVRADMSGERLILSVVDTGVGIDLADQEVVFQEFKQLENSLPADGHIEGSGLGLAITKRFVDELKGDIYLNSVKGVGSHFKVILPIKAERKEDSIVVENNIDGQYDLKGVSVLLVDDDPIQLRMTSEMIKKGKMHSVALSDPGKVLSTLRSEKFDILFTDISMSGTTGFELIDNLIREECQIIKEMPIIALSARSDLTLDKLRKHGFTDFLAKPFDSDQLYRIIYRYVNEKTGQNLSSDDNAVMQLKRPIRGVEALIEFVKDDRAVSVEILQSFIDETESNLTQLNDALLEKDLITAENISHKMLPIFRMIDDQFILTNLENLKKEGEELSENDRSLLLSEFRRYLNDAQILIEMLNGETK